MDIQQIDTRHGTANQPNFSNGNCQPYTGVPFGMNYFAPQTTDQKAVGGSIQKIVCFKATVLPISQVLGWVISVILS